jgi:hypothetical protein
MARPWVAFLLPCCASYQHRTLTRTLCFGRARPFASAFAFPSYRCYSNCGVFSGLFLACVLVPMARMASLSGSSTALGLCDGLSSAAPAMEQALFFVLDGCFRSRAG